MVIKYKASDLISDFNLNAKTTLTQLSEVLGTEIKKYIGITFNDYLNNIRLKYACNLLTNTNYTIKEIAF